MNLPRKSFVMLSSQIYLSEFIWIILPVLLFGMFTQGLSPEDPMLKIRYYLLLLAIMPAGLLLGLLIGLIRSPKIHQLLLILLDGTIFLLSLLLIVWFTQKFSILTGPAALPFVGWHWYSEYQLNLLSWFMGIGMGRIGLGFFSIQNTLPFSIKEKSLMHLIIGIVVTLQYFIAWSLGSYIVLFVTLASLSGLITSLDLLFSFHMSEKNQTSESNSISESSSEPSSEHSLGSSPNLLRLYSFFTPFYLLLLGIGTGFIIISFSRSNGWLYILMLYGFIFCIAALISLQIPNENPLHSHLWLIFSTGGLGLCFYSMFQLHFYCPNWLWIIGFGLFLVILFINLSVYSTHSQKRFIGTLRLILWLIFYSAGIGGGIAIYQYAPLATQIVAQIVWILLAICGSGVILSFGVFFWKKRDKKCEL